MAFIDIKKSRRKGECCPRLYQYKERNSTKENDEAKGLEQQVQLQKTFTPLIKATQESTNDITEELKKQQRSEC